jgi:hypothetical protein
MFSLRPEYSPPSVAGAASLLAGLTVWIPVGMYNWRLRPHGQKTRRVTCDWTANNSYAS